MPRRRSGRLSAGPTVLLASPPPAPSSQPQSHADVTAERVIIPSDLECAICLQPMSHPVVLPCSHIFCFLCAKGICNLRQKCAMCRKSVPPDYILNPKFLFSDIASSEEPLPQDTYQWFYEGRNGWWQYDEHTSEELEQAYTKKEKKCDVLVAGFLYVVDFEHMMQFRQHEPNRRRRIKRDRADASKKGVAGIRTAPTTDDTKDLPSTQDGPSTSKDLPSTQDGPPASKDSPDLLAQPLTSMALGDDDQV